MWKVIWFAANEPGYLAKCFYIFFRLLSMFYFSSFICPAAGRSPTVSPYCICINETYHKVHRTPQESVGGCSSPSSRPWAHRWRTTNICDVWPVRRQTYGYLPSRKASPPIGWYQIILLGDRGTCVL